MAGKGFNLRRCVPMKGAMPAENKVGRARTQAVERHIGARMRERRIMLGLTQQQMAELIGVTSQQAHKYGKGINRIAASRLYSIAQASGSILFFGGSRPKRRHGVSPTADASGSRPQLPEHSDPRASGGNRIATCRARDSGRAGRVRFSAGSGRSAVQHQRPVRPPKRTASTVSGASSDSHIIRLT